jgi:hypothetical protein
VRQVLRCEVGAIDIVGHFDFSGMAFGAFLNTADVNHSVNCVEIIDAYRVVFYILFMRFGTFMMSIGAGVR